MITEDDAQFYREEGYLLIPGVLSAALLERLRTEADATIERANAQHGTRNMMWGGDWAQKESQEQKWIDAVQDLQCQASVYTELLMHGGLLDAMEMLIGPNVQLHHTKLLAKPPQKGGGFPLHQDYPYFPHAKHTMLAASIYLDDADEENGCIRVIPGSHKMGPLACDPGGFYLPPEEYPLERSIACPARAGDALVFNYLTIHGSGPNVSTRPRRNILIEMRDPEDLPIVDRHVSRSQGMMLRGINPLSLEVTWNGKVEPTL